MKKQYINNKSSIPYYLNKILIISAIIIFFASLEALDMAKSPALFSKYITIYPNSSFNEFINYVLINYFTTILEPVIIALFSFFTYKKFSINWVYKLFFGGMVLIRAILLFLKLNTGSPYYYIIIVLYLIYFVIIVTIKNTKRKENA